MKYARQRKLNFMRKPGKKVIREFNDRGLIWLLESIPNLRDLMDLVDHDIALKLDFTQAQRMNRSFIPSSLNKREADIFYRVRHKDVGEVFIYLLIEHQSAPDAFMALKYLVYLCEIWESERRTWNDLPVPRPIFNLTPIIPILLYTGESVWNEPARLSKLMKIPSGLEEFVPQYKILTLALREMPLQTLTNNQSAISLALNLLKASNAPIQDFSAAINRAIEGLEQLPPSAHAEWQRAMYYLFLLIENKRDENEQLELNERVISSTDKRYRRELRTMIKTAAEAHFEQGIERGLEQGIEQGMEQGMEQGIEKGMEKGKRELLISQIHFKFDPLSVATERKLMEMSEKEIDDLSLKILSSQSLSDLNL